MATSSYLQSQAERLGLRRTWASMYCVCIGDATDACSLVYTDGDGRVNQGLR